MYMVVYMVVRTWILYVYGSIYGSENIVYSENMDIVWMNSMYMVVYMVVRT